MRVISISLLLILGISTANAQLKIIPQERIDSVANPPLSPAAEYMKFDVLSVDAGEMNEYADPHLFEYRFKNVSRDTLKISRLVSTCSCATALMSKKDVPPGESGEISIKYNPKGHPGRFERRVFVYTGDKLPSAVLRLKVNVKAGDGLSAEYPVQLGYIRAERKEVMFRRGASAERRIAFENVSASDLKLSCDKMMLIDCLECSIMPEILSSGEKGVILIKYYPDRRHPASGSAQIMLKGLGVSPSQSAIKVMITE